MDTKTQEVVATELVAAIDDFINGGWTIISLTRRDEDMIYVITGERAKA